MEIHNHVEKTGQKEEEGKTDGVSHVLLRPNRGKKT